jgi:ATP-independent RNA helicase DbpA
VVGTPGRIEDHLRRETLFLDDLNVLVLDEADRMLEMGFEASLDAIIEQTPDDRQSLLFSATFPDSIQSMAQHILRNPEHVKVESVHNEAVIRQHFYQVDDEFARQQAVKLLLMAQQPTSAVIFCNMKKEVQRMVLVLLPCMAIWNSANVMLH